MATSNPVFNTSITDVPRVIWSDIAPGDSCTAFTLKQQYGLAASVQVIGTFGGATITMQVSNDGTNWATARGLDTTDMTFTATGYREFSLSAAYMRPLISSGSGSNLSVVVVLRGSNGV
jgi:hypothetical protein